MGIFACGYLATPCFLVEILSAIAARLDGDRGRKGFEGMDWWRGAVIYQVYPRSFQDSDGDGVGDLRGITMRLPYIASLGVDALWISPFFKSPMEDFGYDVEDYRQVDRIFGTLEDCDQLIEGAHRLGIKIVFDMVLSLSLIHI